MREGSNLGQIDRPAQPQVEGKYGFEKPESGQDPCEQSKSADIRSSYNAGTIVAERLEHARRQGQLRLLHLRGPTIILGLACEFVGGLFVWAKLVLALAIVGYSFIYVGISILFISLVPSDVRGVPMSLAFVAIPMCFFGSLNYVRIFAQYVTIFKSKQCYFLEDERSIPCLLTTFECCLVMSAFLTLSGAWLCIAKWLFNRLSAQVLLKKAWILLSASYFLLGCIFLGRSVIRFSSARVSVGIEFLVNAIVALMMCAIARRYDVIVRVQSWLMSRGEAATAAAGIAEILGGKRPEQVLALARASFSCVRASDLTYDDLLDNKPNPGLAAFAQKASLGHVDAFVSHSWHDDANSKWDALQLWREEFRRKHNGMEPTLWIDKYCIDQNSIQESLACLPIYISGCKQLLILCGTTYLSRLWCLIEIFVFLEMGGKMHNLEVRFLEGKENGQVHDQEGEDPLRKADSLGVRLSTFDSCNARCFTEYDTLRLQRVLEITGTTKINNLVSEVFVKKLSEDRHS